MSPKACLIIAVSFVAIAQGKPQGKYSSDKEYTDPYSISTMEIGSF